MVRRKNDGNLTVDGTITADNIAAGTITTLEIKSGTITADNIAVGTLTANEIHSGSLTADVMDVGMLTGMMVQGSKFRTNKVDYSDPKNPVYSWPSIEITQANGFVYALGGGASDILFQLNPQKGVMLWQSDGSNKNARFEIDPNGIRLYPAGTTGTQPPSVNLSTSNGSISITGSATVGHTITGATLQTSASNPRAWMDDNSIQMNDANNNIVFRLLAPSTAASGAIRIDTVNYPRFYLDSNPTNGAMTFYAADKSIRFKLDFHTGGLTMVGPITTGGTITGATLQTAATGARVVMSATVFEMLDASGNIMARFLPAKTSTSGAIRFDTITYPRFLLETNPTTGGMFFYPVSGQPANLALSFVDGSVKIDGALITTGSITGSSVTTGVSPKPRILMDPVYGLRSYTDASNMNFYITMDGTAVFKGTVTASTITGTNTVSGATINGGTINSTKIYTTSLFTSTINGATFTGSQNGGTFNNPGLSDPSFGGTADNSGAIITGGTVRTSGGARRVQLVGDQIQFFANNVVVGLIEGYDTGATGDILIEGYGSSGTVDLGYGSSGVVFSVSNNGKGAIYSGGIRDSHISVVTNADAVYCDRSSGYVGVYTSSVRYKKAVQALPLDPAFMDIVTASWSDKPNRASVAARIATPGHPRRASGFTAENLHRIGATDMVSYDRYRKPFSIQQPAILAHTVRYTQWLVHQVEELTARVAALEGATP